MNVYTWSGFSKRRNSTKRPTGTGTLHNVRLKEATSIEKPTFVFQSNDFSINYVRAFDHYYFVDDIKSVRQDIIEVSCSMDVGATYKSQIGNYNAYIERSNTLYNEMLPDPLVTIYNREIVRSDVVSVLDVFRPAGVYILSVLNDLGSGTGFTSYYLMDIANIKALASYCNTDWGNDPSVQDVKDWLQKTFLHTAEAVISCMWLPFSLDQYTNNASLSATEQVKIGVDLVSVGGNPVQGKRFVDIAVTSVTKSITIPHTYTDFRKAYPYTSGKLFIPGYGMVDFNPLDFTTDTITLTFDCDLASGDVCCYLKDGTDLISTYTYNTAVSCPIAQMGQNVQGMIGGALGMIGGIAVTAGSGGAVGAMGGALSATASAVNLLAAAAAPTTSVRGSAGGRAIAKNGVDVVVTTLAKITSDPNTLRFEHGRIAIGRSRINTCSGYVKCSNADVPIAGMESDKQAVNDLLNGGFYYE